MTKQAHFRLDYPPSVNTYWRSWRGRVVLSARGLAYRTAAAGLTRARFDVGDRLRVALALTMPDKRIRDIDNVAKAVLDAIGHAGIYDDDSQIDFLSIQRLAVEPPGCVDVTIAVMGTNSNGVV